MYRIAALFGIPVLIWGTTWFVITDQLKAGPPEQAVFFRFLIACVGGWIWSRIRKISLRVPLEAHPWLAVQGLFVFSLNYILTYHAEKYLSSGWVALVFSLLLYFNMWGQWIFFKQKPEASTGLGALLGAAGLLIVFRNEILSDAVSSSQTQLGLTLAIVATLSASLGNLTAHRQIRRGLPVYSTSAWAMIYGCGWSLLISLLRGDPLNPAPFVGHWVGLVYLALPGTLIAFNLYLELIKQVGPTKAAYASIAIPVVALGVSSVFEGLKWDFTMLAGVLLVICGNLFVLINKKSSPQS